MSLDNPNLLQINGYCAKGYQPLKDLFVSNFYLGNENNAQLCVYVKDECVVDLCGTAIGDSTYTQESLQVRIVIYFYIDFPQYRYLKVDTLSIHEFSYYLKMVLCDCLT